MARTHSVARTPVSALDQDLAQLRDCFDLRRAAAAPRGPAARQWLQDLELDLLDAAEQLAAMLQEGPALPVYQTCAQAIDLLTAELARSGDDYGLIQVALQELAPLHARAAVQAGVPAADLVPWLLQQQLRRPPANWQPDVFAYRALLPGPALNQYKQRLQRALQSLQAQASRQPAAAADRLLQVQRVAQYNRQRLAVLEADASAIIQSHGGPSRDPLLIAQALDEAGLAGAALNYAHRAVHVDLPDGSRPRAGALRLWLQLLDRLEPERSLAARLQLFHRYGGYELAEQIYRLGTGQWPEHEQMVFERLRADSPRDAVRFGLQVLQDPARACDELGRLEEPGHALLDQVISAVVPFAPERAVPLLESSVEAKLLHADRRMYPRVADQLRQLLELAAKTGETARARKFIAQVRMRHANRPRLLEQLDRGGLPR